MNYELAEQLKEAGFPQKEHELSTRDTGDDWPRDVPPYKWPYNPILEEILEACGSAFERLEQHAGQWNAFGYGEKHMEEGQGSTAAEAAARLWLALNGKGDATLSI